MAQIGQLGMDIQRVVAADVSSDISLETFIRKDLDVENLASISDKLNWTPDETFATGIRKTVEWYLENTVWCDRVKDGSYQGERLGVVKS